MPYHPGPILPRHIPQRGAGPIRVAPELLEAAGVTPDAVYAQLKTTPDGLTDDEAARRREEVGPNVVAREARFGRLALLGRALVNPLVILLALLAVLSLATGDVRAAIVMAVMIVLGVGLRFIQEARADTAAARLKAMIRVTATVIRVGNPREIPLADLVPGDVVKLAAGDMIPADLRVCSCKDLYVIQASLTGEAFPVEKSDAHEDTSKVAPLELRNVCFLGTSVESGTARGVIVATGPRTYLGGMAGAITAAPAETSFDRGVRQFTWLMIRFILVMVPTVFLINGLTKGSR
jgi:Mg2+-importing ATPase